MAAEPSQSLFIGRVITGNQTQDKYVLQKKIGTAPGATVFKAEYLPNENGNGGRVAQPPGTTFVALKVTRNESRARMELGEAIERISRMGIRRHPNIVGFKNWFVNDGLFCLVMEYMDEGSLSYIVSKKFKNGMPEDCMAIALREAIRGLLVIHYNRGDLALHKTFSAADIFVNSNPTAIKLATQVTSYKHDPSDDKNQIYDLVDEASTSSSVALNDYTTWTAAPDFYNSNRSEGYTKAADIWLVGVTALELAYGGLHASDREGFDAIIAKITKKNKLPTREKFVGLNLSKGKKVLHKLGMKLKAVKISKDEKKPPFSEEFEQMVLMCLDLAPEKRPTIDELRRCNFIRKHLPKGVRYFRENALNAN